MSKFKGKSIREILDTEWSGAFETLVQSELDCDTLDSGKWLKFIDYCQRAMVVSAFKYGAVTDGYGPGVDRSAIGSVPARVERYTTGGHRSDVEIQPGNTEWLVDVYNFAMIEFMTTWKTSWGTATRTTYTTRTEGILKCVRLFQVEYTLSNLIWIAKLAFEEYCDPTHPGAHFRGTDNESPGRLNLEEDGEHFLSEHPN